MNKKPRPRKQTKLLSATDVLEKLMEGQKMPFSHAYQVWKLRRCWKSIVGEVISKHSLPLFYLRGTLFIWSENSTWTQEFVFLSESIKENINNYIGHTWIKQIRFQLQKDI